MTTSAVRLDANAVDVTVTDDQLVVVLADGRELAAPLAWLPRLLEATPDQRRNWRLIGGGHGIHWADVDEDAPVVMFLRANWRHCKILKVENQDHPLGFGGASQDRRGY